MGIGVGRVAIARSLKICGEDARSSPPHFAERESANRRAVALSESVDRVLIAAGARACEQLKTSWPKLSAATLNWLSHAVPLVLALLAFAAMFATPSTIVLSILLVLPTAFRIWVVHSATVSMDSPQPGSFSATPNEELPVYSVIAALYREAEVVDQLLSAIERFNYPAEKLDVIVAVEADDHATRAAITARKHRIPLTVIPVPPAELRTKPKALNVALPLARGEFTVIYDAEDRPERNQLRRALKAFRSAANNLACVQARLCIDTKTSRLARYFTAEYAGHFDIFLPRLAALGLPLPLGGSSNHFRTSALREVGGWDPYNVTEDADLGMRFARFGYRCGVIESTTYEEAPADVRGWLNQRSRWFKGWMQTWLVHMREPLRLFRELGPRGFLTFQLIVGGNALVALAHPFFIATMIYALSALISQDCNLDTLIQRGHYVATTAIGYCTSAYLGWLGLSYRGALKKTWILMYTPAHWLLLSLAAWWAALELITRPYFWKKTEHGLDKASRRDITTRALLGLERHLTELKRSGELPQIWDDVKDSAVNRRPLPRAAA